MKYNFILSFYILSFLFYQGCGETENRLQDGIGNEDEDSDTVSDYWDSAICGSPPPSAVIVEAIDNEWWHTTELVSADMLKTFVFCTKETKWLHYRSNADDAHDGDAVPLSNLFNPANDLYAELNKWPFSKDSGLFIDNWIYLDSPGMWQISVETDRQWSEEFDSSFLFTNDPIVEPDTIDSAIPLLPDIFSFNVSPFTLKAVVNSQDKQDWFSLKIDHTRFPVVFTYGSSSLPIAGYTTQMKIFDSSGSEVFTNNFAQENRIAEFYPPAKDNYSVLMEYPNEGAIGPTDWTVINGRAFRDDFDAEWNYDIEPNDSPETSQLYDFTRQTAWIENPSDIDYYRVEIVGNNDDSETGDYLLFSFNDPFGMPTVRPVLLTPEGEIIQPTSHPHYICADQIYENILPGTYYVRFRADSIKYIQWNMYKSPELPFCD